MMKRDAKEARGGRIDIVAAIIYAVGVMEKTVVRKDSMKQQLNSFLATMEKYADDVSTVEAT